MKKRYETPKIERLGDLRRLTLGEGWAGSDDSFYGLFRYGTDPSS